MATDQQLLWTICQLYALSADQSSLRNRAKLNEGKHVETVRVPGLICEQDVVIHQEKKTFFSFFRFLHYLDAVHLGLDKSALQLLAEDFR